MVSSAKVACVMLSQRMLIDVKGKSMSLRCVKWSSDPIMNSHVGSGTAMGAQSSTLTSCLGSVELEKRLRMSALAVRWRFRHRPECKLRMSKAKPKMRQSRDSRCRWEARLGRNKRSREVPLTGPAIHGVNQAVIPP